MQKLEIALPDIAERCRQNPTAKYENYLPEEIKKYL